MIRSDSSLFFKRPALVALLLFITGIYVALLSNLPQQIPLICVIISLFIVVVSYLKGSLRISSIFTGLVLVFLGWYITELSTDSFPPNHVDRLADIGGRAELIGTVVEEPDIRKDRTYLVVEADTVSVDILRVPSFGKVRVSVRDGGVLFGHADRVRLLGYLYKPSGPRNPDGFDYGAYLRTKDVFAAMTVTSPDQANVIQQRKSLISSIVSPLREWLVTKTRENLSPVSSAILSGFILGERRDIPDEYQELFRNTGTLHLMAVSGSNVGVVVAIFAVPLTLLRVPKAAKTLVLLIIIVFFAFLTRLQPSVVRASIMASVGLLAYGWLRKPDYINLLVLAGLLMLMLRPMQLFDVGFQLSFAATFGIIYSLPRIFTWLAFLNRPSTKWLHWILGLSVSTIAAQAAVMPLMAHYFQNVPLAGILANIPVGQLAMASTILGVAFYFSTIFSSWLSYVIAIPLGWMLDLVAHALRIFASLPYANVKVASPGWPLIVAYWAGLYAAYEALVNRRLSRRGIVVALIALNMVIWSGQLVRHADWSLEFIDLGRNRAWIFSGRDRPTIACYDPFVLQDDVQTILVPRILNHYNGKLDMLLSSMPGSPQVKDLAHEVGMDSVVVRESNRDRAGSQLICFARDGYVVESNLPAGLKIVWPPSDNNVGGRIQYPALQIDIGDGAILLASWTGMETVREYQNDKPLKLLEMPWSDYATSNSLKVICDKRPELVVFSPGLFSVGMPRGRNQLTHSVDRLLSTSICGGFTVSGIDTSLCIETMTAIAEERGAN